MTSGTWLAGAYVRLNENEKAMPLLQSIVPRLDALYGPDHPLTVGTMETLAACHRRIGEPERAVAIYDADVHAGPAIGPTHISYGNKIRSRQPVLGANLHTQDSGLPAKAHGSNA